MRQAGSEVPLAAVGLLSSGALNPILPCGVRLKFGLNPLLFHMLITIQLGFLRRRCIHYLLMDSLRTKP